MDMGGENKQEEPEYLRILREAGPIPSSVASHDEQFTDAVVLPRSGLRVLSDDSGLVDRLLALDRCGFIRNVEDFNEAVLRFLENLYHGGPEAEAIMGELRGHRVGVESAERALALLQGQNPLSSSPKPLDLGVERKAPANNSNYDITVLYGGRGSRPLRVDPSGRIVFPQRYVDIAIGRQGKDVCTDVSFFTYRESLDVDGAKVPYVAFYDTPRRGVVGAEVRISDTKRRLIIPKACNRGDFIGKRITYVGLGDRIALMLFRDYDVHRDKIESVAKEMREKAK